MICHTPYTGERAARLPQHTHRERAESGAIRCVVSRLWWAQWSSAVTCGTQSTCDTQAGRQAGTEVDHDQPPSIVHQQVAWVRVGVEEPQLQQLLQEAVHLPSGVFRWCAVL